MGRPTVLNDLLVRGDVTVEGTVGGVRSIDFGDVTYSGGKYKLGTEELAQGLYIHAGDAITGTSCTVPNGARIVIGNGFMRTADVNASTSVSFAAAEAGTTFVAKSFTPAT